MWKLVHPLLQFLTSLDISLICKQIPEDTIFKNAHNPKFSFNLKHNLVFDVFLVYSFLAQFYC